MPFKSKAQKKWMFANKPAMAKQWEADTPKNTRLPEKAPPKKKLPGIVYPTKPKVK